MYNYIWGGRMKTKYIRKIIIFILSATFLVGCSNNLKSENLKIKNENNQLKQQLDIANEKVKTQNELYDLRNTLDSETNTILLELSKGNVDYLKDKTTDNTTISGNKIVSTIKNNVVKAEFEIPTKQLNLRQRAYMLSDDKKQFHSIYEVLPMEESNILRTLHVYFILENGKWKLDCIMRDE